MFKLNPAILTGALLSFVLVVGACDTVDDGIHQTASITSSGDYTVVHEQGCDSSGRCLESGGYFQLQDGPSGYPPVVAVSDTDMNFTIDSGDVQEYSSCFRELRILYTDNSNTNLMEVLINPQGQLSVIGSSPGASYSITNNGRNITGSLNTTYSYPYVTVNFQPSFPLVSGGSEFENCDKVFTTQFEGSIYTG